VTSAREIAETYHIPLPILAKVLQKLAGKGLVKSVHGTKGGYVLAKQAGDITLAMVVEVFEGPLAMTECFRDEKITCPQWDGCTIKSPLYELNHKIYNLLVNTTVADLGGVGV
jgi:Rrf2 family protein